MDDVIKQIAEKFGVDEDKAANIANSLHGDGHNVGEMLQGGDFMEKAKDLLGDKAHDLLSGIPGIGGFLGNMFGGGDDNAEVEEAPAESEEEE